MDTRGFYPLLLNHQFISKTPKPVVKICSYTLCNYAHANAEVVFCSCKSISVLCYYLASTKPRN